jgi:hypothetical protein
MYLVVGSIRVLQVLLKTKYALLLGNLNKLNAQLKTIFCNVLL